MGNRPGPLTAGLAGAALAAPVLVFALLPAASLAVLAVEASRLAGDLPWARLWRIVLAGALQAGLSTTLSLALGMALALALARRRFPGRGAALRLLGAAIVLPAVVVTFGVVAAHGRSGVVNAPLRALGLDPIDYIFGLGGVVLAHVALNMPIAARIYLAAIEATPAQHHRLAHQLAFTPGAMFRLIDWPRLRAATPDLAALVFVLCFTSFAVPLTLAGGPRWATLEVAIFQALRLDFDVASAAFLALAQFALLLCLAVALGRGASALLAPPSLTAAPPRVDARSCWLLACDLAVFAAAAAILGPIIGMALSGVAAPERLLRMPEIGAAAALSLLIAAAAAAGALAIALAILHLRERLGSAAGRVVAALSGWPILLSPLAFATGLFLAASVFGPPPRAAPALTAIANACLAAPFMLRILDGPFVESRRRYARLALSLGVTGVARWRIVEWPALRPAIGHGLAVTAALSLGDLGAMALFGGQDPTLPLLIQRLLGAYRMLDAAVASSLLMIVILGIFALGERIGREGQQPAGSARHG
jgi:thiamine transport system permease protein